MKSFVFGHKNPDTDAILSACVLQQYLTSTGVEVEAVALGAIQNEAQFVLDFLTYDAPRIVKELPQGSEVYLVDHNEAVQSIDKRETLIIKAVFDHHKFGDFTTNTPLLLRCDAVGCTATVLYDYFLEKQYHISKKSAAMMISAIISDTLLFKSPTTTQKDRDVVEKLLPLAGIDNIEKYASGMFDAKSDLSGLSAQDIVVMDFKCFGTTDGGEYGVGVLETTNTDFALSQKQEIIEAIRAIRQKKGLKFLLFCIIDILQEKNIAIIADEQEKTIAANCFNASTIDNIADLGKRVSRKKQLIPFISC